MFKVGDNIPASPESTPSRTALHRLGNPDEGQVIYIHPEGRYYTLAFQYEAGAFRECRDFSVAERELGIARGVFRGYLPIQLPSIETKGKKQPKLPEYFLSEEDFSGRPVQKIPRISEEDLCAMF